MKHAALIAAIEERGPALTARVLDEMYRDPFWHARFGERADRRGREDGNFHLQYLAQALASDDPNVMHNYARWLQQVLTTRGMCTPHLAENFDRLAAAIHDAVPDSEPAIAMLRAATEALRYDDGAARRVQDLAGATAEERELLAYAADAIALAMPAVFTNHVAWRKTSRAALDCLAARVPEIAGWL